jgi:hypothetical protein
MSMPGFTGEASLYKTGGHYHMVAGGRSTSQIMPSLLDLTHDRGLMSLHQQGVCNAVVYFRSPP